MTDYYDNSSNPLDNSFGDPAIIRTEFFAVKTGLSAKLAPLTGNSGKIIAVNAAETAQEALTTTGTGNGVRATSPTLVTPVLGVAAATSINKVSVTTPATGSTLTIADGQTLTVTTGGTLGTSAYTATATPTTLGLVIGTNVQAYDADLTTWAGVTPGTGVATALAVAVGTAGAPVVNGGALGTPSSGNLSNATAYPGTSALTTVGALNSGSITSGFGAIDVGADAISGGAGSFTTLSASGNLMAGQTSPGLSNGNSMTIQPNVGYAVWNHLAGAASGTNYFYFGYGGGTIGSITQNGTTAVAYNTTSDYRLKTNVRPANAARFMDIEFHDYEWTDGRHDCGPIAHELQAIYPDLVIGEKDATEVRQIEITPAVPAVTDQRLVSQGIPAEYTTVMTDEVVLLDGVETPIARPKIVETKAAVEAVYETVEVTPAIPAVTEDKTFPVYQQVNYTGLIGRMGTRIQQLQRTVDAMEARFAALEAK
jgi:hypothetical protein